MDILKIIQFIYKSYFLFNIKDTNKYYLDYQGFSNGYEYDDAIEKIINLDVNQIKTYNLEDAIDVLIQV